MANPYFDISYTDRSGNSTLVFNRCRDTGQLTFSSRELGPNRIPTLRRCRPQDRYQLPHPSHR